MNLPHLIRLIGSVFRTDRRFAAAIAGVLVLQLVSVLATLWLPSLNADIIDKGLARGDIPYIWRTGGIMLIAALVQIVTAVGVMWLATWASTSVARELRKDVFAHVNRFDAEDMAEFPPATLITRGTNDIYQIQVALQLTLGMLATAPIMAIGGVVMALRQDAGLSWLVAVAVVILAVVVTAVVALLLPLFTQMQERLDAVNAVLREQISGIRVVRAFGREDFETQRFAEANADITRVSLNVGRVFVILFPVVMLILNAAITALMWFGGQRIDAGLMQIGSLTAFMQYMLQILIAVVMGAAMIIPLPRAFVCARRVTEVLAHSPSLIDAPTTPATDPTVTFDRVTYCYPGADAPVLEDISFEARPGTTTAVIGSTGAGKTTLLSLIPRLRAPRSGVVSLGGVPTTELSREQLASTVSMVPQEPYLFSGTVATNLRFGNPDATDDELWAALRVAQADFVEDLGMPISQGGTNVSGGQRQRLCIARMFVANPKVLLFDDSFSALDPITESNLQAAMAEYTAGAVTILVAQKVSSIVDADQILVMEAGRIVDRGTHESLLANSPTYQEIVASQEGVDA
ncbi:ABC transporter ATP-binding protein [Corynebacterium sp. CCUG 69979]|uniref:ABC transporter ATP-binding protein n=1 Tax=Corynebacterium sp. CCUG 69979 TaxID=2823890 RepID=UPI00210C1B6B